MSHKDFHYWDCWTLFQPDTAVFHYFRLFAEMKYWTQGQHDKHSRMFYGTTRNLEDLTEQDSPQSIIEPSTNSSIWTGCAVRRKDGMYMLFYTERTTIDGYWAEQSIRCAVSEHLGGRWTRVEEVRISPRSVDPDEEVFRHRPVAGDRTIHAWRDPYVFGHGGQYYMLLAAKLREPPSAKAACIALLRADDATLLRWSLERPFVVSGYEELEVPQVYCDADGRIVFIASTWGDEDYAESLAKGYDPLVNAPGTTQRTHPRLLRFSADSFADVLRGRCQEDKTPLHPGDRLYAGVVVPELKGAVIGFSVPPQDEDHAKAVDIGRLVVLPGRASGLQHPDPALKTAEQAAGADGAPSLAALGTVPRSTPA